MNYTPKGHICHWGAALGWKSKAGREREAKGSTLICRIKSKFKDES